MCFLSLQSVAAIKKIFVPVKSFVSVDVANRLLFRSEELLLKPQRRGVSAVESVRVRVVVVASLVVRHS